MIGVARLALLLCVASSCGQATQPRPADPAGPPVVTEPSPAVLAGDASTGFDLYVTPEDAAIVRWTFDGEPRSDKLPARLRGIAPGRHMIRVDAPGFKTPHLDVLVELGRADKVVITLETLEGAGVPAVKPTLEDGCDEVSCLLTGDQHGCCARYRRDRRIPQPSPPPPTLPDSIDPAMVRSGMTAIRPRIVMCGNTVKVTGTVKVMVTVTPQGLVGKATVSQTPDAALGTCVADAMRSARFARTQHGGVFTMPFVF